MPKNQLNLAYFFSLSDELPVSQYRNKFGESEHLDDDLLSPAFSAGDIEIVFVLPFVLPSDIFVRSISQKVFEISI
jgi:hypothetical protein